MVRRFVARPTDLSRRWVAGDPGNFVGVVHVGEPLALPPDTCPDLELPAAAILVDGENRVAVPVFVAALSETDEQGAGERFPPCCPEAIDGDGLRFLGPVIRLRGRPDDRSLILC